MNPAILQAAAAERTRDMHAAAAACRHVAEIRRSRRSQAGVRAQRGGRGFLVLRVLRSA
jgi:hypothetical protein